MIVVVVVVAVVFLSGLLFSVLHALLIMVQATTLNVAFNSHNKSLLTIMMSNNVSTHTRTHARARTHTHTHTHTQKNK